jgi:hypothetical protein
MFRLSSAIAIGLLLAGSAAAVEKTELPRFLSAQAYQTATHVAAMPSDVRRALAVVLHQRELRMAEPGERFNASCVMDPNLPMARFSGAALNEHTAVVHFETGGFVRMDHIIVFDRGARDAVLLWRGYTTQRLSDADALRRELSQGSLVAHRMPGSGR